MIIVFLTLSFFKVQAQAPAWSVNSASYSYNMTITCAVNLDYVESEDKNDKIAAFIDGECRGVTNLVYNSKAERYIAYLMVYSNSTSGTIKLKVYDASANKQIDIPVTVNFEVNGIIGIAEAPYICSNPTLSNEAKILTFGFNNQVGETSFNGNNISVLMPYGTDLTSLIADYTSSDRAKVKVGDVLQESGVTSNDFTDTLEYKVRSADETTSQIYNVSVRLVPETVVVSSFFSPNGDDINDCWTIKNPQNYKDAHFYIYDNAGQLVYESVGYNNDWNGTYNGKALPIGVYIYKVVIPNCNNCDVVGTISLVK